MSQIEIPTEILAMPVADRIELVGKIWDSIAEDARIGLTAEHRAILEQRLAAHRENSDDGISWDELKKELRNDK